MRTAEETIQFLERLIDLDRKWMEESGRHADDLFFFVNSAKKERAESVISFIKGDLD